MLSPSQRTTILGTEHPRSEQAPDRAGAGPLPFSRSARFCVRNSPQVPELRRPEKAQPYRQQILELFASCKGNLVRVHEELLASGAQLSYQA